MERPRIVEALRRPWVAALVVIALYAVLALLNSTRGYLGTDTGAKVITLDRMAELGTNSPAVGYWAGEWDPAGDYHPLFDSRRNNDGEWVNVTTLPMLIAARPLYDLGGYRLALALPMLGALLAAFACRDLARRLADDRAGWWAFWIVALASPLSVYALDLWEHSLGAGLMLAAVALLHRTLTSGPPVLALVSGLCLGLSATMRAETFVVAFVAVGATCLVLVARRRVVRSLLVGVLSVVSFAAPWLLNAVLESGLGGNSRTTRVSREAQREWWTELGERVEEALVTWFGVPGGSYPGSVVLGALAVGAIIVGVVLRRRGEHRSAVILLVVAAVLYLIVFAGGLGFVSGALVASPFAAAAVLVRFDSDRRFLLAVALAMTVLIWTFQLTGGAGPQWGGRYILVPTMLLTVLGVVALVERPGDDLPRRAVTGLAIAVTVFGVVWLNQRSHDVDAFFADLADRPEDVIISTNGFFVREAGPAYEEQRYLSVGRGADVDGGVEVVRDAGFETFAVLTQQTTPPDVEATLVSTDVVDFLGVPLSYHRYELETSAAARG